MLRVTLAVLHLLGFAAAAFAILSRAVTLRQPVTGDSLRRAFRADNLWALAAALLVGTGLWRYLASIEKITGYYNGNRFFLGKMGLLGLILALEVWPMITLLRWRRATVRGAKPEAVVDSARAGRISTVSFIQALLMLFMVIAATAMARGYGSR